MYHPPGQQAALPVLSYVTHHHPPSFFSWLLLVSAPYSLVFLLFLPSRSLPDQPCRSLLLSHSVLSSLLPTARAPRPSPSRPSP
ncbi:hypothetical protein VTK73DRAFT_3616 [Phialemonium thermophilum]|uniref:Uncharacterized protein n=1 Tax=Phialemonium thermophilum TaxID=223376 RepID=A0ABR3VHK8_9PEZI